MEHKKGVLFIAFALVFFLLPFVLADIAVVDKIDKGSSVLVRAGAPAYYDLVLNNTDTPQSIQVYSLAGMNIQPTGILNVPSGISTVSLQAYPEDSSKERYRGPNIRFEYSIKNLNSSKIIPDFLYISIYELSESLSFNANQIQLGDTQAQLQVKNLQNAYIQNLRLHITSSFFDVTQTISLKPNESQTLSIPLNKDYKDVVAGSYLFTVEASADNAVARFDAPVNYIQKTDVSSQQTTQGFLVRKEVVQKTNIGNVPTDVQLQVKKDIFSRLFTIYSVEPTNTQREGFNVVYSWNKNLAPTQSFSVVATTNYTFPFFFVLLVVIIALSVYAYTRTSVVVNKRVSYVKTRGGEFALKVRVHVKAKKFVEDLQVVDQLPGMTTLYEKFGIKPTKIDTAMRRLTWNVERLNAGEERVFSYIIYSKVRVVGRFELPSALVVFEREGKTHEVLSNRTFFISEVTPSAD